MSVAERVRPASEATAAVPVAPGLLQRSCACGSGAGVSGLCGSCQSEQRFGAHPLQAKFTVSSPGDPFEVEADRAADAVMNGAPPPRMSIGAARGASAPRAIERLDREAEPSREDDDEEGEAVQAKAAAPAPPGPGFAAGLAGAGGGTPLPPAARTFFEHGLGHDFGHVRVHDGSAAAALAHSIHARAFTHGRDIYFGAGAFDPVSSEGKRLLAHELAHTVQQADRLQPDVLSRAVAHFGKVDVLIDYSSIIATPAADFGAKALSHISTYTGAAATAAQASAVSALATAGQQWLLFGLQIHIANTAQASTLGRVAAVDRLIAHAPLAATRPLGSADLQSFAHEVLEVSGWLELAVTSGLSAPSAATKAKVNLIVNPPPSSGSASDPLNSVKLESRLKPALRLLVSTLDPGKWVSVGKRSLSTFQAIGDQMLGEARNFFTPYADAGRGNIFSLNPPWHASANVFDTGTLVPTVDNRLNYLRNRAEIIGRADTVRPGLTDLNIFADTNFDASRPADRGALEKIVADLEKEASVAAATDRLIQHTGQKSGSSASTSIGLVTEFNAATATACSDHWRGIDTVCHEVLHALVHPDFQAASTRYAFPQVIREGFTEVLGVQLFNNRVLPTAATDAKYKASLETGVVGAPCPSPAKATIDYGAAGQGAEEIRSKVGDDRFRAAYFLGRTELAGLP